MSGLRVQQSSSPTRLAFVYVKHERRTRGGPGFPDDGSPIGSRGRRTRTGCTRDAVRGPDAHATPYADRMHTRRRTRTGRTRAKRRPPGPARGARNLNMIMGLYVSTRLSYVRCRMCVKGKGVLNAVMLIEVLDKMIFRADAQHGRHTHSATRQPRRATPHRTRAAAARRGAGTAPL